MKKTFMMINTKAESRLALRTPRMAAAYGRNFRSAVAPAIVLAMKSAAKKKSHRSGNSPTVVFFIFIIISFQEKVLKEIYYYAYK
jgi:hypothetical protein